MANVSYIGGSIRINNNGSLNSLNGLENLTSILGTLYIADNYSLSNLYGLENVTNIEGLLEIRDNANLINLTGLNNLISVGNSFDISGNDALISLSGLDSLSTINGELEIGGGYPSDGNPSLIDISTLENLAESSISNLKIRYNNSLTACAVQSICNYLASPNGFFLINNNATGCNSPEEVQSACLELNVQEVTDNNEILIYPNPVYDQALLRINLEFNCGIDIYLYNTIGLYLKKWQFYVNESKQTEFKLDFSKIPSGTYYCRIQIGRELVTKKLIILR